MSSCSCQCEKGRVRISITRNRPPCSKMRNPRSRDSATSPDLRSGDNALGHARELCSHRVTGHAAAIVEQLPPFGWVRVPINTVAIAVCAHDHLKRIQLFLRTRVPRFPRGTFMLTSPPSWPSRSLSTFMPSKPSELAKLIVVDFHAVHERCDGS